jgi:hypothetical protein
MAGRAARMSGLAVLAAAVAVSAAGCGDEVADGLSPTATPKTPTPATSVPTLSATATAAAPSMGPDECDPEAIERDLAVPPELAATRASVVYCEPPGWAVIRWDAPGDNQRIVRLEVAGWTTYVQFPHDVCRTQARTEGVPPALEEYFSNC